MINDDRGIADAMYTMMSVAIVMMLAIAISGVVLSTTMKQGKDVSSRVAVYDTGGMRKGACAFYFLIDAAGSDFASGDPNSIVLKSSAGETYDASIAFSADSAPAKAPRRDGCIIWSGYIYAPADSSYIFQLASSAGSWLWVDDSLAIDNHGLHGQQAIRSSGITLTKGYHLIKVRYFYRDLPAASCALSWDSGHAGTFEPVTGLCR
ncbi:MAG TPA: PA14 domain-containing protein [Methanocellaceae archaeon]